jgi:hypothetical protein
MMSSSPCSLASECTSLLAGVDVVCMPPASVKGAEEAAAAEAVAEGREKAAPASPAATGERQLVSVHAAHPNWLPLQRPQHRCYQGQGTAACPSCPL